MENIYHWILFEENQTREREVIEQTTRPFASQPLYERVAMAKFYIDTKCTIGQAPVENRYFS
jgi:hypothetical protein